MRIVKLSYFSNYNFNLKLLLLAAFVISLTNCGQPDARQNLVPQTPNPVSENAINLNTANAEELEKLPRVGTELAKKIIEYREKNGKFRRAENLILVRGMSDKKFRDLKNLVKVE